jgi:hypothetical protein
MLHAPSRTGVALPPWLVFAVTVAIVLHLTAVVLPVLSAPSGPWASPGQGGRAMEESPRFALAAQGLSTLHTRYLRMGQNYHHVLNRPGDIPGVELEVRLRNSDGELIRTLKIPNPDANPWVRHRQELLVRSLAPDLPVDPPGQEMIAPAGKSVPTQSIWVLPEERLSDEKSGQPAPDEEDRTIQLRLRDVPQHLVPRTRSVMRPSEWTVLLARSYARHLCREYGAASAEVLRHTREPISPAILAETDPGATFDELVASFGKVSP